MRGGLARSGRGAASRARGAFAERAACAALEADGFVIHATRWKTEAGEIDIVAERQGLLVIVEVKARATLNEAAHALSPAQQVRLIAAAECLAAAEPQWGRAGMRFDVIVVDAAGTVRRIADAFRVE